MLSWSEVKANRLKWANYLIEKRLYKNKGGLQKAGGVAKCCLGHGCHLFNIHKEVGDFGDIYYETELALAPDSFMELVGLSDSSGYFGGMYFDVFSRKVKKNISTAGTKFVSTLVQLNDNTDATPKEIGLFIKQSINDLINTPFLNKKDYERKYGQY